LRWIEAKLVHSGPAGVDADLALSTDLTAALLRRVLQQDAHLLAPLQPVEALADTLVSRLDGIAGLETMLDKLTITMDRRPRLTPRWPMPDQAHPAIRRVLTGHTDRVVSCAVAPDSTFVVTTSYDGTARIWDPATGTMRHTLTGHLRPVVSC